MGEIFEVRDGSAADLLRGCACSFGVFDGVHRGHRFIIGCAAEAARKAGSKCVVITFDTDPDEMFRAGKLKKIMSNEDRLNALAALDVDAVVVLPFTREFAAQPPMEFLATTFGDNVPASLHVGSDFHFGSKAAGGVADLVEWGSARGMQAFGHELLLDDGTPVTSTRIRGLLAEGKVEEAAELLQRPYSVSGVVQAGRGEGRDFGFRTANLHVPDMFKCLGDGVYAAYVWVEGARYKAAVSNGVAPTFAEETKANVEVHILDFEGDLYGKTIKVEFVNWLRPMMTFPNVDELVATVTSNINWVRENL